MVAEVGLHMILIMCKMIFQLLHMCPHMVAPLGLQMQIWVPIWMGMSKVAEVHQIHMLEFWFQPPKIHP